MNSTKTKIAITRVVEKKEQAVVDKSIAEIVTALESGSPRFVSLVYRAKESNELAKHLLLLNFNYANLYQRDLRLLENLQTLDPIENQARLELIESLKKSLRFGVGNNPDYTRIDTERKLYAGISYSRIDGTFHLKGFSMRKTIIEEGEHKFVNSNAKTIAKNKLKKLMRSGKIREFRIKLENFAAMRLNGKELEISAEPLI